MFLYTEEITDNKVFHETLVFTWNTEPTISECHIYRPSEYNIAWTDLAIWQAVRNMLRVIYCTALFH
jgi:hypothetical protein